MKVISPQIKTLSIAVSLKMFDTLQPNANYISQIPETFKGFQTKQHPYFIMEENMLIRILSDMKERELQKRVQNKERLSECVDILTLILKEKPALIFFSFHA